MRLLYSLLIIYSLTFLFPVLLICSFNVPQKGCGTVSQSGYKTAQQLNTFQRSLDTRAVIQPEQEVFLENTIVIQHDPDFQEAGDTARRLRCVWGAHSLQKSVNAKMPEVYQPSTVYIYCIVEK